MSSEQNQDLSGLKVPWPPGTNLWAKYDLHCHCGAIRYTIKLSPPLFPEQTEGKERYPVTECHCSHCERHGALMVHPLSENVEFTQGLEHRGTYLSASGKNPHYHCLKCGNFVGTDISFITEEMFKGPARWAINLRMLKDFDSSKLEIEQAWMMKDVEPVYQI